MMNNNKSSVERQKGVTTIRFHTQLDPFVSKVTISVERQKGLSTSHLHTQLDPFVPKLAKYLCVSFYAILMGSASHPSFPKLFNY